VAGSVDVWRFAWSSLPVPAPFKVSELECRRPAGHSEALPVSQDRCSDSDSALTGALPRARLQDGAAAPAERDQGEPMPRPASACDAAAGAAADRPAVAAAAAAQPPPAAAGVVASAGARPPAEVSHAASAGQAARRGLKRKLGPPGVVTAAMARRKRARRGLPPPAPMWLNNTEVSLARGRRAWLCISAVHCPRVSGRPPLLTTWLRLLPSTAAR